MDGEDQHVDLLTQYPPQSLRRRAYRIIRQDIEQ
jgi:hypothetical protein